MLVICNTLIDIKDYYEEDLRTLWGLVGNDNPHLLHQEAGVHVPGDSGAQAVGEGQLVVGDVCLEAVVADVVGEEVDEGAEEQVVGGDDAVCL